MISLIAFQKTMQKTIQAPPAHNGPLVFNLPQAQVQLKASVTSGRLAS